MNILDKIIAHKEKEVAERKSLYPTKLLEQSIYFSSDTISLRKYLLREDKVGIIAEIKRKSPSKGMIHEFVSIEQTSISYMQGGASALSILTDNEFFGGNNEDLSTARKFNYCPILRKDFTIDEYQIIEAKSIGADAILLIAAALSLERLKVLAQFAKSLGLEVLMEVHNEEELNSHLNEYLDVVGVNNRDLKTFKVNTGRSLELIGEMPPGVIPVSESGLSQPEEIRKLRTAGYSLFLMGENFMKQKDPGLACQRFINNIKQ